MQEDLDLQINPFSLILAVTRTGSLPQNTRRINSCLSDLNRAVHLRLGVMLHVLQAGAPLAGGGDRVIPPAAPRHGQVTVVRQLGDAFAARSERNTKTREQVKAQ